MKWQDISLRVKGSFGVAEATGKADESPESLVIRADRALYRAKGEGRDGVRAA
jgi:PleD family two-component response regulator